MRALGQLRAGRSLEVDDLGAVAVRAGHDALESSELTHAIGEALSGFGDAIQRTARSVRLFELVHRHVGEPEDGRQGLVQLMRRGGRHQQRPLNLTSLRGLLVDLSSQRHLLAQVMDQQNNRRLLVVLKEHGGA